MSLLDELKKRTAKASLMARDNQVEIIKTVLCREADLGNSKVIFNLDLHEGVADVLTAEGLTLVYVGDSEWCIRWD